MSADCLTPVSYTHLDVYKRQNLYGTQAGWTESSLQYRDPEHGGMTWTSQYADSKGIQYTDGMIPEGVFKEGTIATLVDGTKMDVSGLSYACLLYTSRCV